VVPDAVATELSSASIVVADTGPLHYLILLDHPLCAEIVFQIGFRVAKRHVVLLEPGSPAPGVIHGNMAV